MRIIEPSFRLETAFGPLTEEMGIKLLRWVEFNARISHRSEEAQTEDSWKRFIKAVVVDHGDLSVIEHGSVTAIIRTDRGICMELIRHRLFSFTAESTRFVNYKKKGNDLEFIRPIDLKLESFWCWDQAINNCEREYFEILEKGGRPQDARSVLPNALAATISVTGNLRSWRHFFLMRSTKESHPDMRRIVIPMLEEMKKCIPLLFDDITPNERQVENLRKAR